MKFERARRNERTVSTLEHEVGDDSVEAGGGVSEAVLSGTELSEVSLS